MITAITGLTQAGKSTLQKFLIDNFSCTAIIEYTTRPMRTGEVNHRDYHFVDDSEFDKMYDAGEFAETLFVKTEFGLYKYGARKEDLTGNGILICGPHQMKQLLDNNTPMLSVLLDIDFQTALDRMRARNNYADTVEELKRRITSDEADVQYLKRFVTIVLNAKHPTAVNAATIMEWRKFADISTAQNISISEKRSYFKDDSGLMPYLKMRENGMPEGKIEQIAWLLLTSGCAFCKVCREKPCDIKSGSRCTDNIADYIRQCVHDEDDKKNNI